MHGLIQLVQHGTDVDATWPTHGFSCIALMLPGMLLRHAGAARRLALHLAEDLVVAWTCLRLPALERVARPLQPHFHLRHSGDSNT